MKKVWLILICFGTMAQAETCSSLIGQVIQHLQGQGHKGVYGSAGMLDGMGTNWSYGKVAKFFGGLSVAELSLRVGNQRKKHFVLLDTTTLFLNLHGQPGTEGYRTTALRCRRDGKKVIVDTYVNLRNGVKGPFRVILEPWIVH